MHLYKYIVIHFSEAIFLSEKSIFICITQHLPWFNPAIIPKRENILHSNGSNCIYTIFNIFENFSSSLFTGKGSEIMKTLHYTNK